MTLDLADIQAMPRVTRRVTLECAGNGRARLVPRPVSQPWLRRGRRHGRVDRHAAGADAARGGHDDAVDVAFTGADHGVERGVEQDYQRGLPLAEALRDDVLLVHTMNGQPLPPQHGAPLRLLVPGWYGMAQVKWLTRISVLDAPFDGYQNVTAYRIKHGPGEDGEPVTRIQPRALVQPPGFPDFQSRTRILDLGSHELTGRAWSGWAPVSRVEVSVDGGVSWDDAELGHSRADTPGEPGSGPGTSGTAGHYALCARATDASGNVQPVLQPWNRQGMANNQSQRVPVVVR